MTSMIVVPSVSTKAFTRTAASGIEKKKIVFVFKKKTKQQQVTKPQLTVVPSFDSKLFAANEVRLRAIQKEDPLFWQHLRNLATELSLQEVGVTDHYSGVPAQYHYLDEHNYGKVRGFDIAVINQRYRYYEGGELDISKTASDYSNPGHPMAWLCPLVPCRYNAFQCLNPVYLGETVTKTGSKLRLTTSATGYSFEYDDIKKLHNGELVEHYSQWDKKKIHPNEKHFALPVETLVRIMLETPNLSD